MSTNLELFNTNVCKDNKFVKVTEEGEGENKTIKIKYLTNSIEKEINTIIMNKLNEEKKQIEDIALNVISGYKSKLLEDMQTTIIKTITEGLEDHLKNRIENDKITEKIVNANVKNFNDLLSGHEDKSFSKEYSDLLNFDNVCKAKAKADEEAAEAEADEEAAKAKADEEAAKAEADEEAAKAEAVKAKAKAKAEPVKAEPVKAEPVKKQKALKKKGGRPKRKKYTRKSHRKRNKQQTRRVKGGEGYGCIEVSAICKMVTMKIIEQTNKFKTEINKITTITDSNIGELKTKLQTICFSKTVELLDDFAKQAIDISSLDDIFKMLIFEITNVVKSNMKELDKTICKKSNKT